MRTYIIGAGGFLGGHLAKAFGALGEVATAASHSSYGESGQDAWQKHVLSGMKAFRPDLVLIPGASQVGGDDPDAIDQVIASNCVLPAKVASTLLAEKPDAMLVTFGSSWQFADSDDFRPFNLYAATKQAGKDLLEHYALRGLRILQLILFDTYSETDTRRKLYTILVDAARKGESIDTTPGAQEIDLVHIDDVCRGVLLGVEELGNWAPQKGVMVRGLGSGAPITVSELIDRIGAIQGVPIRANRGGRGYRPREVMRAYRAYQRPAGWQPIVKTFQCT